jgi:hypothetical protein
MPPIRRLGEFLFLAIRQGRHYLVHSSHDAAIELQVIIDPGNFLSRPWRSGRSGRGKIVQDLLFFGPTLILWSLSGLPHGPEMPFGLSICRRSSAVRGPGVYGPLGRVAAGRISALPEHQAQGSKNATDEKSKEHQGQVQKIV